MTTMTMVGQWLRQSTFTLIGISLVAGAALLSPIAAHADGPNSSGWGGHASDGTGFTGPHSDVVAGFTGPHAGRDDGSTSTPDDQKPCVGRSPDGRGKTEPAGTEITEDGPNGTTIHLVCDGATGQWVQVMDVTAGSKILRTPSSVVPKLEPQVYSPPIH